MKVPGNDNALILIAGTVFAMSVGEVIPKNLIIGSGSIQMKSIITTLETASTLAALRNA